MKNKYRIFIGLKLSGYLTNIIPMIRSTIDDKKQLISWIHGRNLHLTLSFIGEIDCKAIEELKEKLHLPKLIEIGQRYYDFCRKVHAEQHLREKKLSFGSALSFKWSELQFIIEQKFG